MSKIKNIESQFNKYVEFGGINFSSLSPEEANLVRHSFVTGFGMSIIYTQAEISKLSVDEYKKAIVEIIQECKEVTEEIKEL